MNKKETRGIFFIMYVIALLSLTSMLVFAESEKGSPEAYSFSDVGSGGDVSANGDMSFSLPIMTVPGRGSLSFPITLSYSSGIRLDQEASFVGLGFNLGAGVITRDAINLPDDYLNGWLNNDGEFRDQDFYQASFPGGGGRIFADDEKEWHFENWRTAKIEPVMVTAGNPPHQVIDKWIITTEDGTRYVFGEGNGKTEKKVNTDRTEHFICAWPYSGSHTGYWDAPETENDLTTYYTYAWYLTSILSADYVDLDSNGPSEADKGSWIKINYAKTNKYKYASPHVVSGMLPTQGNYAGGDTTSARVWNYSYAAMSYQSNLTGQYVHVLYNRKVSEYDNVYISSIETPIARANFDLIYDRTDSRDEGKLFNPPRLDQIRLTSFLGGTSTEIGKVKFTYSYDLAKGTEGNYGAGGGRLTLKSVTQYGKEVTPLPPTTFGYYGENNLYYRFADDWFGFYTGIPPNSVTVSCLDIYDATYCSIPGVPATMTLPGNDGYKLGFCQQATNPATFLTRFKAIDLEDAHNLGSHSKSKSWSIKNVTYPTGGSIKYDYEGNRYNADSIKSFDTRWYGGPRVKSKTIEDGLGEEYTVIYEYPVGVATLDLTYDSFVADFSDTQNKLAYYIAYEYIKNYIEDADYGYTKTYYRTVKLAPDGIVDADLGGWVCKNTSMISNASRRGQVWKTEVYNEAGALVSMSQTTYDFGEDNQADFNDDSGPPYIEQDGYCNKNYDIRSTWARPTHSESTVDGVTSASDMFYYEDSGLPKKSIAHGNDGDVVTYTTYAYQDPDYSAMLAKNMLSQPFIQAVGDASLNVVLQGHSVTDFNNVKALSVTNWDCFDSCTRWYPKNQQVWKDADNDAHAEYEELITTAYDMTYNNYGALTSSKDANGNLGKIYYGTDNFACSNGGLQYKEALPTCVENAKGQKATTQYDVMGNVLKVTDMENAVTTRYEYDEFGRLVKTYLPNPLTGVPETQESIYNYYYYGAEQGLTGTCNSGLCSNTGLSCAYNWNCDNPNMVGTRIYLTHSDHEKRVDARNFFDGLGRSYQTQAIKEYVNGRAKGLLTYNEFNALGKTENTSKPILMEFGQGERGVVGNGYVPPDILKEVLNQRGVEGGVLTSIYYKPDPLARVDEAYPFGEQRGSGLHVKTNYYGEGNYRVTEVTDLEDKQVKSYADKLGRTYKTIYPDDSQIIYTYDTLGNVLNVQQIGEGMTRVMSTNTYNTLSQVLTSTDMDGGTSRILQYDNNGNIILSQDANNIITRFQYDSLNRLEKIDYKNDGSWDVTNTYDSCTNGKGRLCSVAKENYYTETYAYDKRGRVTSITYNIDNVPRTVNYEYDNADNVVRVIDPDGYVTEYIYNNLNQLQTVRFNKPGEAPKEINYTYTDPGKIDTKTYPTDITTDYNYNVREWVESITVGEDIFSRYYEYTPTGNLQKEYKSQGGALLAEYGYDDMHQLTTVTDHGLFGTDIDYEYDDFGNRKRRDTNIPTTYTYDYFNKGNRLLSSSKTEGFATRFDGLDDYIEVPYNTEYQPTEQMTIEAWVYVEGFVPADQNENEHFEITNSHDWDNMRLFVNQDKDTPETNKRLRFVQESSAGTIDVTGRTIFNFNQWYHVATTYDGRNMRVFVNGKLDGQKAASGSILHNPGVLEIGRFYYGYPLPSNPTNAKGFIRDVRIYDVALTETEIKADKDGLVSKPENLVGWWKLDEYTGNKAYDSSGNGNDGDLKNNPSREHKQIITEYSYDAAGNTIQKVEDGKTTKYKYDATNMMSETILTNGKCMKFWYDASGRRIKKWYGTSGKAGEQTTYIYGSGLDPLAVYTKYDVTQTCSEVITYCGDGFCGGTENKNNCQADCGAPKKQPVQEIQQP